MKPISKVIINGTNLSEFKHLSLVQTMYDHHSFKIVIGHEVIEELGGNTLNKSKDWLGKVAIILLGTNVFVGIVTNVNMQHGYGLFGDLVVSGYSQTILLEAGPHLSSWTDQALRDIVDEVMAGLKSTINPKYQSTIGYMTQYRESNFQFLKRIACQYNEWFFYDGEQLLFGEPSEKPVIPLFYGTDMDNVNISLKVRPVKYEAFSYHSMRDQPIEGVTQNNVRGLGELGAHAFKAAQDTFIFSPRISSGPRVPDKGSLDDMLENIQNAAAANLSMASGNSSKQDLRPGVIIDFKANVFNVGAWKTKPFGQYLVTAVHHQSTGTDTYINYFEAVPAGVKVPPEPAIKMPTAYPQIATVLSNDDPDKKGRIQVQFQWQMIEGLHTNWIRVMTPDAGVSDKVGTNRGWVTIPEVGDQVMIGFRYGDPARPFVMGSLFHGISGAGGDANNKMKSFTTKSGSTMTLNEDEGSIVMRDAQGNNMHYDGAGNISITSAETITLSCGSSTISMKKDGKIDINGVDIKVLGGNTIDLTAEPIEEGAAGTISMTSEKDFTAKSKTTIVDINAKQAVSVKSEEANLNLSGKTTTSIGAEDIVVAGSSTIRIESSDTDIF